MDDAAGLPGPRLAGDAVSAAGPRLRAAIVGAGLMGGWHADSVARAGGAVACVVDADVQRAQALAARYPGATAFVDLATALAARPAPDVVHLCTPLATHAALAEQALRAGCHVLAEKPLAETADVTAALLDLARERGRLLCPVHQFLFQPGVQRAFAALDRIGPLLHVDLVACSAGAVGPFALDPDRLLPEILPHPLALLARLLPGKLADAAWHVQHPRPGELRATAQVGDVSVGLLLSAGGRPTTNTLRLVGARGTAHADLFHGYGVVEGGGVSRMLKVVHPFLLSGRTLAAAGTNLARRAAAREPAYPGLRDLVRRFYAAARGEAEPPISPQQTLDVATARDRLAAALLTPAQ